MPTDPMPRPAGAPPPTQVRLAEAAIRVIAQQGFDVVSVRTVAAESGLSAGTVQYHHPTRQDLLVAALTRSAERQAARVETAVRADPATSESFRRALLVALRELLPFEGERHEDAAAWVSFGAAASTRQWLADLYWVVLQQMRDGVRTLLENAQAAGRLREGLNPEEATRVVTALVNGLTLDVLNAPAPERDRAEQALDLGLSLVLTD